MRVLILGLNYLPESTSIGPYTSDLAEHLLAAGHRVQVVTGFPMAPQWQIWDGYRNEWFRREAINRVPIVRSYLLVPKNPRRALSRVLFDTSFSISSLLGTLATDACDIVVAISPPLQLALTGWIVSRLRRTPLFLHIQDLVPDAAVATGMLLESSMSVRVARRLERFAYRHSAGIGVICDGFRDNLKSKGVDGSKIAVLPNCIDLEFMQPYERAGAFRTRWGIQPSEFLVMYSGSVGLKQGLETLIEAAIRLRHEPEIRFVIVGEGPCLDDLIARAKSHQLTNVRFLPLQPREDLPQQLAAADMLAITQKQAVTDIVFPGKLLYYMAAARPILAAVSAASETGRFIAAQDVGVVTPPEDSVALANAIVAMRQRGAGEMGRRGRAVVERRFDRRVVLPAFVDHLETVARRMKDVPAAALGREPHNR
jgi:colanic acid biosynthesis glycosyl transferase WcaI